MTIIPAHLFVYGTLMHGFNNPFAQKLYAMSNFVGNGSFPGLLYKVDWYPGAVYAQESSSRVCGEVYEVLNTTELLTELDEYEDVFEDENSSLYIRRVISVQLENKSVLDCWVYLYNQTVENLVRIESGKFLG